MFKILHTQSFFWLKYMQIYAYIKYLQIQYQICICRYMESKDPTVFTKTYEEGVERVLKVKLHYKYIYIGLRYRNHPYPSDLILYLL